MDDGRQTAAAAGGFVLLAYPRNFPWRYEAQTPLSVFALGALMTERGFRVEYFDERVEPRARFDALLAAGPLACCLSVMGGYQVEAALRLTRRAKALAPRCPVVWGGYFPTVLPEAALAGSGADFLIRGEGETGLPALCRALAEGAADLSSCPGLAWRKDGRTVLNPQAARAAFGALPFPYSGAALPLLKRYLAAPGAREAVGYETSRGCGSACGFCYSPAFHGEVRVKPLPRIKAELAALAALGVRELDVYDDLLLGGDTAAILDFCGLMRAGGFSWSANLRIDLLTAPLLRALELGGCRWLYFGLESDDDALLARLGKGYTAAQLNAGLALLEGAALTPVFSVIAGLPEGGAPLRTLELAERLRARFPAAEVQIQSYLPQPGSALYGEALRLGWRPPGDLGGWAAHGHFTVRLPWLAQPDLPARLYFSSFLAWRYRRHFSAFPANLLFYPLHLLAGWRLRHRRFGLFFERALYDLAAAPGSLLSRL